MSDGEGKEGDVQNGREEKISGLLLTAGQGALRGSTCVLPEGRRCSLLSP